MSELSFFARFQQDFSLLETTRFNPYYISIMSGLDDPVQIDGKPFINLASNNYLGLATDERVKKAIINGVEKYGASLCGTPIATGYFDLYRDLEKRIAAFAGIEDCIILPSCYQANNGLFSAIADKDDVIIIDHFAHSSLIEGAMAPNAKIRPFVHNDMRSLEKNLQKSQGYKEIFVVTESVFSTEGAIAPFAEITDLCRLYGAIPIIDDSHGIGVIGKNGKGILEHSEIINFSGVYTASLGKAIANTGGVIGGKKSLVDFLRYNCRHLIYSTALPPSVVAGVHKVLDIIESEFTYLSSKMWHCKEMISITLKNAGIPLTNGEAPITSIIGGNSAETVILAKNLFDNGILSTPFIYPSVPKHEGKVRLIAGANLTDESINRAVSVLKNLRSSK